MVRLIKDGISVQNGKVLMNTDNDNPEDIINILHSSIYKSDFEGNIYYFGYVFNSDTSRADRTTVIKWLKGLSEDSIDDNSLRKFIRRPLLELNKEEDLSTFDAILYPRSNRSNLTHIMINEVGKLCQHNTFKGSFELVKTLPINVEFDWNLIADNVKPKYRQYIQNYLTIEDSNAEKMLKSIQRGKLLIIDDINTSGSTLTEILRIVHNINNNCEIYIFTLIGKE